MKKISFLFTGDVMAHNNQLNYAKNNATGQYDFSYYFSHILNHIRNTDVAVCNLETTIAGGDPTGYPRFNTPEALAAAIARAGFTCVATANNHTHDSNQLGIQKTREALEKYSLKVVGTRKTTKEKAYVVLDVNGVKVGLLNYTYETAAKDGLRTLNNRAMNPISTALINSFSFESIEEDLENVRREIEAVKKEGADVILIYYHWGNEYERYSNVFQKYVAWRTAHMGVDAIIGSHAHVLQEISEVVVHKETKDKHIPVFYGLGNYIWGGAPMYGRETVMNNILALLDINYDEQTGDVQVTPSYVPLYIARKDNHCETLDMQALSAEEISSFEENFGISAEKVMEQIQETVENRLSPIAPELYFEKIFQLKEGKRKSLLEDFLPKKEYISFYCEDALVATALQNGYVIGNSPGYVGMTAVDCNGNKTAFLVRVLAGEKSSFPIIVNEHNSIRDIYQPPNRVTGEEYGLYDDLRLCKPAAEAWKAMLDAASKDKIYLKALHAMRYKVDQLKRQASYAKVYGDAAAKRRYQKFGCTEHHLGLSLDVSVDKNHADPTPKAEAFDWIFMNCRKFGFVPRKVTANVANVAYIHLRYLEDFALVQMLNEKEISIEEYLTNYDQYKNS